MKRREFGLLAGTSLATAATLRPALAQSAADPSLLTTTLTPMGAERAGNEDGSIPAWTGGLTAPPLPQDQPTATHLFEDEQPLYTVSAANMAQYADLLTEATKYQIQNHGLTLNVYKTHRTGAAPQYVYDNAAKNVTRAQLDPRGGRFGFNGAVGGPPFPIINTSDPQVGGTQLIWNHLTAWVGYSDVTNFAPGLLVIDGRVVLVAGQLARTIYPYYAPDVTPENFDGYYSKGHYYMKAPSSVNGQETLTWHTTNVNVNPDIVWTLLNGQGRVRKAPNEQYDTPNPESNGIANLDESSCFYGNPSQYNWTYIAKKEMLVPYNCNEMHQHSAQELMLAHFLNPDIVRWEKHRMWVVEATLHPGENNVNAKRRIYIDEDTWYALLGESYDAQGNMVKTYALYNECVPSLPGTTQQAEAAFNVVTGDYMLGGSVTYPPFVADTFIGPQNPTFFEAEAMAASAAF